MTARLTPRPRFALAFLAVAGCAAEASLPVAPPAPSPATEVSTVTAVSQPWPRTLTLTGSLIANRDALVAADAAGKVIATHVERGSVVKKGAPLVSLDRRSAALAQEQAEAQAEIAKAQLALAKTECARTERLFAEGAINQAEYDRARTECEAARLRAASAGAQARLAGKSLGDAVVRAPFSGMVVEKFVTEGEYVRPDSRVIRLVEMNTLRLELAVPEAALAQVTASQDVHFQVAAFPAQTFSGRIRYVGSAVRQASRDLIVEALVDNAHGPLRPGMFATANVVLGERAHVVLPEAAVREGRNDESDRVFVVKNGLVEERLVHVSGRNGDRIALASGLSAGEAVVANAQGELHDGQAVTLRTP
ncbi:MAG: efflux RND transporter periplasmic adaptor subunit [Myxococcales bacterium]|nr:efflux RND transporter periplasmic adaptor subunit [Myxococcales bacterium]